MSRRILEGNRRNLVLILVASIGFVAHLHAAARVNILVITADDMNWDSPGSFGGQMPDVTPNLDRLATEGMRFMQAYVNIALCTPSRSVWLTGRYSHRNGAESFQPMYPGTPTLPAVLARAGYLCGTIGKSLSQQELFLWSDPPPRPVPPATKENCGRNPALFKEFSRKFFDKAKAARQPFFLLVNASDPHRPFATATDGKTSNPEIAAPSRLYRPDEVSVPGFLLDLPEVRHELAGYYSSVRRFDDTLGAVLQSLDQADLASHTLVVFLSDHGMPFPFAKATCYRNGTRTPMIVRWPGRVARGTVEDQHLVSGIDLMPTLLEAAGVHGPIGMDGRSFLPLLEGKSHDGRSEVFTQFYHVHGREIAPMFCVQTRRFGYIFNPWSDGRRMFVQSTSRGETYAAMQRAAERDSALARRFQSQPVEELYDYETDPHALRNEISNPRYVRDVEALRNALSAWMRQTNHPALAAFEHRNSLHARKQFMLEYALKIKQDMRIRSAYEKTTGHEF